MSANLFPSKKLTPQQVGLLSAAVPSPFGDALGLLADGVGYAQDPASLTPGRGLLSLAGLIPGIPGQWGSPLKQWAGEAGNWRHLTGKQELMLSPEALSKIRGLKGEIRGWNADKTRFGNYAAKDWMDFVSDVKARGVVDPILIVKEGSGFKVVEGNHRIQAAIQAGAKEIPVEVKYYGMSEKTGLLGN